ncbi:MAG: hypothetical protein FWD64_01025 [Acidobacteriaceae bacterium]|nr:hypothetical protein [Acidobacteriaceae bacterium]
MRGILFLTVLISSVSYAQQTAVLPDAPQPAPQTEDQPKRFHGMMGLMPDSGVSAGVIPPPPAPMQSFVLATQNSFYPTSFALVGLTSLVTKGLDTHPEFGKGPKGYWEYYWRGFADRTLGSYSVIFVYPTLLRQDTRYVPAGKGPVIKRGLYAASRVFVARSYSGENVFNASEVLGRGTAIAISTAYYPSQRRTAGEQAPRFAYALGFDAATNAFYEFWPDIAKHIWRRHSVNTVDDGAHLGER